MTLKELCQYTGWGMTKAREIAKRPESSYTLRVGNKLYIDKESFDSFINKCMKYHISI